MEPDGGRAANGLAECGGDTPGADHAGALERLRAVSRRALTWADGAANRIYGLRWNPLYHSGAIVVALFLVLLITGLYLLLFYRLGSPWTSVARITAQPWLGRWIRGVHRFASDAAVVAAAVHAFRMYAQRRSWGPRTLAWVSGLILLGLFFVCGWTGYVMVWDAQAQILAMEGARFLDVLPIFSEPIGRTFVGERALPSAFFFLNLFAHVALPIGLGLLVWVHVARLARPVLLPPRRLLWGMVAALIALALVWPLSMDAPADLFRRPAHATLDLFFAFWLPVTRHVPAGLVWLVGLVLGGIALSVPWWSGRGEVDGGKSVVDERACTACEQCVRDCPYDAIALVPRTDGRTGLVARVNEDACVACGICIGSCAPMAIGPAGRTGREQLAAVRALTAGDRPGAGDVVVIACEWSAGGAATAMPGVRLFPIACAGNVHTSTIEALLRGGAGGVMVVSCPERDCRGREGPRWLRERVYGGREAELKERVDRRRVRVLEVGAGDAAAVREAVLRFTREVEALRDEVVDVSAFASRRNGSRPPRLVADRGRGVARALEPRGRGEVLVHPVPTASPDTADSGGGDAGGLLPDGRAIRSGTGGQ